MARAPFNVLVYLYRSVAGDQFEYALFQRADAGFWQGIAGGGEARRWRVARSGEQGSGGAFLDGVPGVASGVNLRPGLLQPLKIGQADDGGRRLVKLDDQVLGLAVVDFIDNRSNVVA